jgi:glucose-1-phosphate thymidylyltransferase
MTVPIVKQLLPVYDKPLINYPISTLMLAGVREILVISTPRDLERCQDLLGDGSELGLRFAYLAQPEPRGIAQALLLAGEFIGDSDVMLILGDNIFHGSGLRGILQQAVQNPANTIFAQKVHDPRDYGVVSLSEEGKVLTIEEKPLSPRSSLAIPGLYRYRASALEVAASLRPSPRGELEISTLNQALAETGDLECRVLPRGTAWFDAGTPDTLLAASTYVQAIEKRDGRKIGCLEEMALELGCISAEQLSVIAERLGPCDYGHYLSRIADGS